MDPFYEHIRGHQGQLAPVSPIRGRVIADCRVHPVRADKALPADPLDESELSDISKAGHMLSRTQKIFNNTMEQKGGKETRKRPLPKGNGLT
jgi:hypothetical protein